MTAHANLVAGKWVSSPEANRNLNPSNLDDLIGEYARADAAQAREAIAAATAAAARLGPRQPAGARRPARSHRLDDPRAPHRARHAALPRGGQDPARGHRRGGPRRLHLQVLRGRGRAPHRREDPVDAAGRRRRDHARAHRRGGHHHAVELPARHPGLEDRAGAGLRQLRGVQAGRTGARAAAGRWPRSSARPARPPGVFNLVMGRGAVVGRGDHQRARGGGRELHRLGRDRARGGPQGRGAHGQGAARDGRQESAGDRRRRRPGRGRELRDAGRVLLDRPALHGLEPLHRHRGHPRSLRRGHHRAAEGAEGGRRAQGRHRDRAGGRSDPARSGPEISRRRPEGRRDAWPSAASGWSGAARASISPPPSSPNPPTPCGSTARRSSARWPA